MAQTIRGTGGSVINWRGPELASLVSSSMSGRLRLACEHLTNAIKRNISISSRASGPSGPGQFPHADTGRLRNSIFFSVDGNDGIVSTNLNYGLWLEIGTSGGQVVVPRPGGTLSWIGRDGRRVFARRVVRGAIAPRRYIKQTFDRERAKVVKILTAVIG